MKKRRFLCAGLALCMALSVSGLAAGEEFPLMRDYPGFVDVPENAWYSDAVALCYEVELMNGKDTGFDPSGTMTLGECAAIAARVGEALGAGAVVQVSPKPGETLPWYKPYVDYLTGLGAEFRRDPAETATRQDFFGLLAAVVPEGKLAPINSITALPDTKDPGVLRFYNAGILTGVDAYGTFAPGGTLSRAEVAVMVARIARPALRQKFTPAGGSSTAGVDGAYAAVGLSRGDVLLSVDGAGVSAEQVLYWANYYAQSMAQQGMDDGQLWMAAKGQAFQTAVINQVVRNKAALMGLDLTQADRDDCDANIQELTDTLDAQGVALADYLASMGVSVEGLAALDEPSYLIQHIQEALFGPGGELALDDKGLADWAEEHGILGAKHILIQATGGDMAAALAKAQSVRAELKQGGDTEALFDRLVVKYGQDPGMEAQPQGYTFGPGEMVQPFEDGTKALKVGQISDPVESSYGYHIILRVEPDWELVAELYTSETMDATLEAWVDGAVIKTMPAFDTLDLEAFCRALPQPVA